MFSKTAFALFASILLLTQVSSVAFANTMPDDSNLQNITPEIDKSKLNSVTLPFIQNNGQLDPQVKFYANLFSGTVFVTEGQLTYLILQNNTAFAVKENFDTKYFSTPLGLEKSHATLSSFVGDKKDWASDVPTFNSISLGELWDFIDVNLIAHGNNVEKLFLVSPGGDVSDIKMKVDGANSLSVSETGELIIDTTSGKISMTAPVAFQYINGIRNDIPVSYIIDGVSYGFVISDYDHSVLLTIDPLLASTFIGGSSSDVATAIAIDSTGRVYVTGVTYDSTTDYPTTTGAYDTTQNGNGDVFVSRFDADLSTLQKSTFIGGTDTDVANSIAIDSTGRVYVTGQTVDSTTDYPVTSGAYDESHNGGTNDVFVSRFDADLSTLQKSTLIGGSGFESATAIALDSTGRVYVTGQTVDSTTDYPVTSGAYDGSHNGYYDVFVSRLDADLSTLQKSTFIGGSGDEYANAIAIDSTGRVYVTGDIADGLTDYPVTSGAYDESHNGGTNDVFVSRFDADLSTLQKSTFIGGSNSDIANAIAIDSTGRVYVTGVASDAVNYPVTSGAYDESYNGSGNDVFVSRFDADLSTLQKSTLIGSSGDEYANAIAIDSTGRVYVTGDIADGLTDYPVTSGAYDESHNGGTYDIFVSRLDADLSTLQKSTFIGGSGGEYAYDIAIDSTGRVYVTGDTDGQSDDPFIEYPTTSGAYDESHNGSADVFVSRFDADLSLDSPTAPEDTAPDVPTELTATAISSTEIELSWTAPADDGGSAITGYAIERECPTGDGFEILVEDTGSTDTVYTDDTLEPDTECNYKVFAINASGISDASNEASATTDAETSDIITFTASGTMAISKTVTKGDFQLEKSKKYNHEISISATIEDCNAKGQIKKFSDISGTFTITNEDLGVDETIDLENIKLTHNSALKKFSWSATQGKGEFNFKSKVNCNEPEDQDGKGSKITKLQADKAKFSSVKVTASDVAFG